jgi:hypothetical protein
LTFVEASLLFGLFRHGESGVLADSSMVITRHVDCSAAVPVVKGAEDTKKLVNSPSVP